MVEFFFQLLSLFLVAAGIFFIVTELSVKFDRSFLYLGTALMLFGIIPAIDIWIIPKASSLESVLLWTRVQHLLAVILFPMILLYLKIFLTSSLSYLQLAVMVLGLAFSPMFFNNAAIAIGNDTLVYGPWYHFIVLPCAGIAVLSVIWFVFKKLKVAHDNERRILFYHFIGFTLLCAFGLIDLSLRTMQEWYFLPTHSFFILGVFAFGLMILLLFSERFVLLVREKKKAFNQLSAALREMEEANALRQIGESVSFVNHEIKNFLTAIKGSAELIKLTENLSADGRDSVGIILKTADGLQNFSQELLQLSRAHIIREKARLKIVELVRQCIGCHFPDKRNAILVSTPEEGYAIHGDWNKLEHVFVNLFKNAFEAEATAVSVHFHSTGAVLLITIYDNGTGCPADQRSNLFKTFFTTKKGKQGTGLGLSISRAVIESHGGHITAYPLNPLGNGIHGLKFNITLPHFSDTPDDPESPKPQIVSIKKGMTDLNTTLTICGNIGVYSRIVPTLGDFEKMHVRQRVTVLAAKESYHPLHHTGANDTKKVVLLSWKDGLMYASSPDSPEHAPPEFFSEDFLVSLLDN